MPDIKLPTTHIAKAGETWASLAYRYWGEETLMWRLIEANPLLARVLVFEGGERVRVPEAPEEDRTAAMPPWRQ